MPTADSPAQARADTSNTDPLPEKARNPSLWVPTLYLAMGIPNVTVGAVSAIMYKNMGVSNTDIAIYTSQLYLPWVLKPIWAPLMEPFRTKRWWVLSMEFLMAGVLGLIAFSLPIPSFFAVSLAFFWIAGFASATQDIAADAVYMTTLSPGQQGKFIGIQGMCWNLGSVLSSGILVWLTGKLHDNYHYDWVHSWMIVMCLIGASMALLGVWHLKHLPQGEPSSLAGQGFHSGFKALGRSWVSFFQKKHIWLMLTVTFFYRFGEGFIEKFGALFLLDSRAVGGLGLNNQAVGNIYGSVGTIGFILGALFGGFFAARVGLRRGLVLLAFALNIPHLTYFYLSWTMPDHLSLITGVVALEKFGFGFGSVGLMLYMMQQIAPGPFKMTHYAFATGIMGMTKWSTGWLSAYVYTFFEKNYLHFFTFVLIASIPPIVLSWLAPFPVTKDDHGNPLK
ncbi:MFS transporter [Opitutaceae bacterium EW11]|nr:MFS transporter [Opitutaceae bacterium EW11]